MPTPQKQVRVFICSTFRDMHAERDHLVTVVFPELRERIDQLGMEFFDVDLRWGVPANDANGETANSWEYCRQWIDRVEPFFVCILGQRYGWVPDPLQLKAPEDSERQALERRSITDMEVRYAVLNGRLKRRSYFYLRTTNAPATASEYVDPPPLLRKLEQLKKEVQSCGRPVRAYPCEWTGDDFTGMEEFGRCVLEDLWSGMLRDERYVSKEVWRQVLVADPYTDQRYIDESQPVPRDVWEKVVALARPAPLLPMEAERQQMDTFAASRLRWFQGRKHELQQLTDFVHSTRADAPRFAVVTAVPGQGKSALLAKLSSLISQTSTFLITHFVGATEGSANAHMLVERLLGELDRSGISSSPEPQEGLQPKRDFNDLCRQLSMRLGEYAGERVIVILLDALNQLSGEHDLQWLPMRLGPGVRVIISCIKESGANTDVPAQRVLHAIALRQFPPLYVPLGPMTEADVREIVVEYLNEYCKELDSRHVNAICAMPQARNPLYLLVMLGELRTLGGNDMDRIVDQCIASLPHKYPNTVSLFKWLLQRLEVFGEGAVRRWCLYLAGGRVGMASQELVDMLARKLGAEAAATALRIERGLRRYLQRRGAQLDFFHGQLRQAVIERYAKQAELPDMHSDVATYFRDVADPDKNQRWKMNARALAELPFHLSRAGKNAELETLFSSLSYLAARVATGQVYEQMTDFALVGSSRSSTVEKWYDFLQKHTQRLDEYPSTLVSLTNHEGFPSAREQALVSEWSYPWLKTSPEMIPVSAAAPANGLRTEIIASLDFSMGSLMAVAQEKRLAFRFERLGVLRTVDLCSMHLTNTVLFIRRERPLLLVCSSDASFVTVFYESGEAELHRCVQGADERPARLELVRTFQFCLRECEDPIAAWHGGAFWFQAKPNALAYISIRDLQVIEEIALTNEGELTGLAFTNSARFVALRQGGDTLLLGSDTPPLRRRNTDVSATCSCGSDRIAVAFTDGALVVYDLTAGLTAQVEKHVGILRGTLGWDGTRLLCVTNHGEFFCWRPEIASTVPVQDNQQIFRKGLQVVPMGWFSSSDGRLLLVTTHSVVDFCFLEGGTVADGRLQDFFGGPIWRMVLRRDNEKEQWLVERKPSREVMLGRGVLGRLYCALDGRGHLFAASGYGPGLALDLELLRVIPLEGCPTRINMAAGNTDGGCWLADSSGKIFFVDMQGHCRPVASTNLQDVTGAQIYAFGNYLLWYGYSTKYYAETGVESARTFVLFRRNLLGAAPSLERIGERVLPMREGICRAVCYDRRSGQLVTVWTIEGTDRLRIRMSTVEEFIAWHIEERDLTGLKPKSFKQAVLSPDGHWLGVLNAAGEFCCVCVEDGRTVAILATSTPFSMVASGPSAAEFWLVTDDIHVYHCALINPR